MLTPPNRLEPHDDKEVELGDFKNILRNIKRRQAPKQRVSHRIKRIDEDADEEEEEEKQDTTEKAPAYLDSKVVIYLDLISIFIFVVLS
jgi:hypothetical protein